MASEPATGLVGRARAASVSVMNMSPQLGMWQATGTAIAQAPNLTELREPESGGSNITFDAHGHSTRIAKPDDAGELVLVKSKSDLDIEPSALESQAPLAPKHPHRAHLRSLHEKHKSDVKEKWGPTVLNGLKAFWKFFITPSGFLITIYGLNIVVSVFCLVLKIRAYKIC
jgi:hypothetical protein